VKTAVSQTLTDKAGSWFKEDAVKDLPTTIEKIPNINKVTNKSLMLKTRQIMCIKFSVKVYEGGNNTLEKIPFALRWDTVFQSVSDVSKISCSESRLQGVMDKLAEIEIKQRFLLLHPLAHAVDDMRINRDQSKNLIKQWSEQGLIKINQPGARDVWLLTDEGERRKMEMNSAKPVA
jgi:hypothetical protein